MNKVLSLLVGFVFLQTQAWALSGGPVYESTGVSLIGTYAGVLVPNDDPIDTEGLQGTRVSSIGLFSVGVPETGLAIGAALFFVNGDAFSGPIVGVADPGKGTLQAIVDTISNFVLVGDDGVTTSIFATGQLDAEIFDRGTVGFTSGAPGIPVPGSTRIEGEAVVNVIGGGDGYDGVFTFFVDGYKQSNTPDSSVTDFGDIGAGDVSTDLADATTDANGGFTDATVPPADSTGL